MATLPDAPTFGDRVRWFGWLSWMTIGILLLLYGAWRFVVAPLSVLFAPIAIAIVVVYLLNPLVSMLERRGFRRGFAVALIYLLFLAVVSTALAFLIPVIVRQLSNFIEQVPTYGDTIVTTVNGFLEDRGLEARIAFDADQVEQLITENRDTIFSFIGGVRTVAGQVLHILVSIVIGVILSIYLLLDLPKIGQWFRRAIPERQAQDVTEVLEKVNVAVGGFFRGQLLVALFVGVASAIGLSIIKLDFAILIGIIAGIFNLIPLIGPFLAAIPAVTLGLLSGTPSRALWAALVLLIVQQIDNHVVSPNVMGRTVRLHPVTVMLALLAGATIAGIFGMLIVIPAVAATKIVAIYLWERRHTVGIGEAPPAET